MNLATWSIRNPIPSIMLFAILAFVGLWGFRALSIQSFPDLDLPVVNVTLARPGASPSQLETEGARKIEDSLATLSGLRHLRTSVTDGRVSIGVEFVLEKGLSEARDLSMHDALVDACSKRARPVVMTTIAKIAGMLPITMGFGADATFRQRMAISVIGGLLTSTALSLLIVPVAFTYVDGFERRIMRLRDRSGNNTRYGQKISDERSDRDGHSRR